MNKFNKAVLFGFVFASAVALCGQAFSQTTTTIGGLTMTNYVPLTPTGSYFHANLSGSDRRILSVDVAKMVLNNLTISNGGSSLFTLTGILTTTSGTLGVLTLTQTTNGVLTLSNLTVSSAAGGTVGASPLIVSGGAGLVSASIGGWYIGQSSSGTFRTLTAMSGTANFTGTSNPLGLSMESGGGIYIRAPSTRYIYFSNDNTDLMGVTSAGVQMLTGTVDMRGAALRLTTTAAAASGTITTSSVIETLSNGVTRTMSITGQAGRIFWYHNIGASTCTLNGGGANINGSSTQGILTGSSALLFSDGVNAYGIIK